MINLETGALIDLIRRPIVNEKTTAHLELNKYTFEVDLKATKPQIKAAIEYLFSVKVVGVNTLRPPRKTRRMGRFTGYKPQYKRAIVTLAPENSINLFPEV